MNAKRDEGSLSKNPLVPIGLTVLGILILPMFLYSNAPEGPIKEGDVVFSTGRHRVHFVEPTQYQNSGYQDFCILEPRDQLLVTQQPVTQPEGNFIARSLGGVKSGFPSCPEKADLVLHPHQATLQSDTWSEIKDTLARIFSSE